MTRRLVGALALSLCLAPALLVAEAHLALMGDFPEGKSLESKAASDAVEWGNAGLAASDRIRLLVFNDHGHLAGALDAARRVTEDPEMLGVVVHGEAGVHPEVLAMLRSAGLPVVAASSWASSRSPSAEVTWLSPSQEDLAKAAAIYARKGRDASQIAIIDNGAPTSVAAARIFAARFKELGGKINFEGSWSGAEADLPDVITGLKLHWPQLIFYAGEGRAGGQLAKVLKQEKELKSTSLIGLPTFFDPGFFDIARVDATRSAAVFPCPDYRGGSQLVRQIGVGFPKGTPEWKAYVAYAYRKPGRWTSMVFDATRLILRAFEDARATQLTKASVATSLNAIPSYKGIRGLVRFSPLRQPVDGRAMVYYALNKVNKKEMLWLEKQFGPPFHTQR